MMNEADLAKSSSAFVLVGLVQGIMLIAADYLCGIVFHPDLVIVMILLVLVLSNGGFHLDGLSDTFDALAAKTQGNEDIDKQKRLLIMKDGKSGPAGITAIVFSLAIKYLSLRNISHFSVLTYYSSLILMPTISKWTIVVSMFYGKPARQDGLGKIFINSVGLKEVIISTSIFFLLLIPLPVIFISYGFTMKYAFYSLLLVTMYVLCRLWVSFFNRKFGGLTGDTLGAISESTEITFLLMVIVWSRFSIY